MSSNMPNPSNSLAFSTERKEELEVGSKDAALKNLCEILQSFSFITFLRCGCWPKFLRFSRSWSTCAILKIDCWSTWRYITVRASLCNRQFRVPFNSVSHTMPAAWSCWRCWSLTKSTQKTPKCQEFQVYYSVDSRWLRSFRKSKNRCWPHQGSFIEMPKSWSTA